ncbi:hypothetical protein BALCAV_0213345 [Alkalihalobacillus alcalophilus ATCC 27647 = CGMCC 1.3604]|uniref:DUF418 domain-containing protein n=1 Tax=Alkalihalobacillus alcalophilus ATCC 27647 = CGMCC 1.3604 TaxID=1218173 RepID=A0A094WGP9_ALKAL|nr:DUF418 domain-containing protein [Alkalihalobacillus alcalophilus]KGA96934.1 hypothetical protein BALCAV_0213345 [Alkalihalobacillus alcalophilus ATCC 27647 = CGMCC 1.3604]MED1562288.1 DUF418 domain-containing protein [Alkalihalobacillus alcalophilus]
MQPRIQLLDVIRGLCLFGILQANLLIFQYGVFGKDELELFSPHSVDWFSYYVVKIFIEGSFMPIFAFLFGYGMVIMRERSLSADQKPKRKLLRRFLLLIILGYLHGTFIWEGDILLTYGIAGLLLLMFVGRHSKTLLIWSITLLSLSTLLGYGANDMSELDISGLKEYIGLANVTYSEGTYSEINQFRNEIIPFEYLGIPDEALLLMALLMPLMIAPLFLFGMYAAKKQWFTVPSAERRMYKKGLFLIPVALLAKSLYFIFPEVHWLGMFSLLGANLLALGYIFLIAFLYEKTAHASSLFQGAASVGKLSLTNYLIQSIVCTLIFYGYGLGLYGKLGVTLGLLLGIGLFLLQMLASRYYLKKWKYGPFEYLLRTFTYWSFIKKTKSNEHTKETA